MTQRPNRSWNLRGRVALVAEGSAHTGELFARSLRREGVGVLVATTCSRALELLRVHPFDLVVVDRDLPGGGGDQLLRRLAADRRHTDTRTILVGTHWDAPDRWMAMLSGATTVLTKPVRSAVLVETARAVLPYRSAFGLAIA
jgi:two-component system, OmpR family, response regulator VanR